MPNGMYGGVRGRKTKVGRKLLLFSSYSINRLFICIPDLYLCTKTALLCCTFCLKMCNVLKKYISLRLFDSKVQIDQVKFK